MHRSLAGFFLLYALGASAARADDLCSILSDVNSVLSNSRSGASSESLNRLRQWDGGFSKCSGREDGSITCDLDGKSKYDEADRALRTCYRGSKVENLLFDDSRMAYSWGNRRYRLYLAHSSFMSDGGSIQIFVENWFVIVGAWPEGDESKLKERAALLKSKGIATSAVKTDNYPKLTPGLIALVLGPTNREAAALMLETVKPMIPDVFIKQGD